MPDTANEFDQVIDTWKEWQSLPWGKLYYSISRFNIQCYLDKLPKRVLDIGGGNGSDSIYYAKKGYIVTWLDNSTAMLAEAKEAAREQGVSGNIIFCQCDAKDILEHLKGKQFDMILCHLMLEFIPNPQAFLKDVCYLIAPGGLLSVIDPNRYSLVYRNAFQTGDLTAALKEIDTKEYFHPWVKRITPVFSGDEICEILINNGCTLAGHYGIRCICDYLKNEQKNEEKYYNALEELEKKLTATYPYYLLARLYQIIVQKNE